MIQVSSAAGGALRPNASSARRKQPTMPSAGSVSVPSKSTRSALRRLGSLSACGIGRWLGCCSRMQRSWTTISEVNLGGKSATG